MRRPSIPGLVLSDSWLAPFERDIKGRLRLFDAAMQRIRRKYGTLMEFAKGYERFGFNRDAETGEWIYREWAPGARGLSLIGDFNGWNRESHPMTPTATGVWELRLPADALQHGQHVKVHVIGADSQHADRIPAWIRYTEQDPQTYDYSGIIWAPEQPYAWKHRSPVANLKVPFIYEAHVGIGLEGCLIACKTVALQISLEIVLPCQRLYDRSGSRSLVVVEEYQAFHYSPHHPEVFLGGLMPFLVHHGCGGLVCLIVV